MDPEDPTAMHMNDSECEEWNETYYTNTSSTETSDHDHDSQVTCSSIPTDVKRSEVEIKSVLGPTVKKKEEL
ncbi:hypothetical protein BRC81_10555 [Halobacteriales archaeon QS_1_68_20]|nr:MAG: hypothetical protein BRC81_10555 [Halobacteriales archaeon QS_1_68_20]